MYTGLGANIAAPRRRRVPVVRRPVAAGLGPELRNLIKPVVRKTASKPTITVKPRVVTLSRPVLRFAPKPVPSAAPAPGVPAVLLAADGTRVASGGGGTMTVAPSPVTTPSGGSDSSESSPVSKASLGTPMLLLLGMLAVPMLLKKG